jgi:2-succinyl-6-hydroxy-2,4-cyclohexadiene-1-carboxylate synthase
MEAFVERWLSQPLFEGLWRIPEPRFQAERERRLRQRPDGLARSLRGMGAGAMVSLWERLGEIAVPTQVVTGVEDARFSRIGARLVTAIPGAELARIPESGHAPHTEQPELFIETLTRFILRHEPLALAGLE